MPKESSKLSQREKFNTDLKSLRRETRVFYYKSRGPGGQRKDKRETAVRLFHPPSGITVVATEYRFQARNKALAFKRLQKRLFELNKKPRPRIPTRMPRAVKEEILRQKKLRTEKKRLRKKVEIPPNITGSLSPK